MMKATWKWIDSYVGTGLDAEAVAEKLTMAGTEVERTEEVGDDVCYTLEVTSNRTDCLSVIGLARELAACTGKVVNHPEPAYETGGKASEVSSVTIEPDALEHCPYYTAQVIRNVKVGPSPEWLKERLEGIGLKPINNIVDITNFVMYETGQPLHAFDKDKLAGGKIVVRMAKDGERFDPLVDRLRDRDEPEREYVRLDPDVLVIADAENPQAVGGIMGGMTSGVTEATTDVLLESAYFNPDSIKRSSRRLTLASDSSFRFERDVDVEGVLKASHRAAQLIAEVAGGEVLDGVLADGKVEAQSREITVTEEQVARTMGLRVPAAKMLEIFRGLDVPATVGEAAVAVQVPSFRPDLRRPIDLVEEVGRVVGLDQVMSDMRLPVMSAAPTRRQHVRRRVRDAMQGMGFSEALTDTFVSAETETSQFSLFATEGVRLEARDPVNANQPALRRNLLGSLLDAHRVNRRHGAEYVRLYEVANVFLPGIKGETAGERELLGLLGRDYFDLKGALESLLEALRVPGRVEASPYSNEVFAEGRAAVMSLGGKVLGVIGEPSAGTMREHDVDLGRVAIGELDFRVLVDAWVQVPEFEELPRFPTAERDLAFIVKSDVRWADIERAARKAANATLRHVELFDEYTGKGIGQGRKSLAFRLYFRHDDRTLQNEEITQQMDAVISAITKMGGELRG